MDSCKNVCDFQMGKIVTAVLSGQIVSKAAALVLDVSGLQRSVSERSGPMTEL